MATPFLSRRPPLSKQAIRFLTNMAGCEFGLSRYQRAAELYLEVRRLAQPARFAEALAAYQARDWDRAETLVTELDAMTPHALYRLYLGRIRHFRASPPPPEWDGVFTFDVK